MARESGSDHWNEVERRPPDSVLEADAILRLLVERKIGFVVIGDLAVGAYGCVRATKDADIAPNPDPANLPALEDALFGINAKPIESTDFRPQEMPVPWEPGALLYVCSSASSRTTSTKLSSPLTRSGLEMSRVPVQKEWSPGAFGDW